MAHKKQPPSPGCATCGHEAAQKICMNVEGLTSKGCPTIAYDDVLAAADKEYDHADIREFARQASRQEANCYANRHQRPYVMQPTKTRIVEIYEFAEKMNSKGFGFLSKVLLVLFHDMAGNRNVSQYRQRDNGNQRTTDKHHHHAPGDFAAEKSFSRFSGSKRSHQDRRLNLRHPSN